MKNKIYIYLVITALILIISAICITLTNKKGSSTPKKTPVTKKTGQYVCSNDSGESDNSRMIFNYVISFEGDKITAYKTSVEYIIQSDEKYNNLIESLPSCKDTYKENQKITCNIDSGNIKNIIGKSVKKYIKDITNENEKISCTLKED